MGIMDEINSLGSDDELDKMLTAAAQLADIAAAFYKRLTDSGMPAPAATALVTTMVQALMGGSKK